MVLKRVWWTINFLYLAFIYSTLGIMPTVWKKIDGFLSGRGVVAVYIIYSVIGTIAFLYILFIKKEKSLIRYILFFLSVAIFIALLRWQKYPAEKIHIGEYGLLGVFLYNALRLDFDRFSPKLYLYASVICLIAGAIDEVIQWILPNRYFAWQDLFINGISGIIILLFIRFNILTK